MGINFVVALTRSSKIVASSRLKRLLFISAKLPEAKDDTHRLLSGCRSTGRQQFHWLISHSFLEF